MKKMLIIKAGTKLATLADKEGDFEHWIASAMSREISGFDVVPVCQGGRLPDHKHVSAVLITGSGAMVTDHSDWIESTAAWLRVCNANMPVLGICFGHQLLAYAFGGEVDYNPNGIEVGTVDLLLTDDGRNDPVFSGLQDMPVQASHKQSVIRLPPGATCLAKTGMDRFHSFRLGDNIRGVQFHPEFTVQVIPYYIEFYRNELIAAGRDPESMMRQCLDTARSANVLSNFSRLI